MTYERKTTDDELTQWRTWLTRISPKPLTRWEAANLQLVNDLAAAEARIAELEADWRLEGKRWANAVLSRLIDQSEDVNVDGNVLAIVKTEQVYQLYTRVKNGAWEPKEQT